ncbi:MAG: hypothetical protein M0010_13880 [Actinomycetota bacterium]|nr:hypothetical protein [Actinomycetota bacterium]
MTRVVMFGPGRCEDVVLRIWPGRRCGSTRRQLVLRCAGSVRVYCGAGDEHVATVGSRADAWDGDDQAEVPFALADAAWRGDADAAWRVACALVEDQLDWEWEDPCASLDAPGAAS